MFGVPPRMGLRNWRLPSTVADSIETEEELRELLQGPIEQPDQSDETPGERLCM